MIRTKSNSDQSQITKGIEKKAYEYFLKRIETKGIGDNFSDWLRAEKEIKARMK